MNYKKDFRKAVFLDRDGVINKLVLRNGKAQAPYSLAELELFPDVEESILKLKQADYLTIIVTNQPDVARGWVDIENVHIVNNRIRQMLLIDDIKICFHTDVDQCECRKPNPGMLLTSAQHWNIDLSLSYMIGDRYGDIAAGVRAGCKTILVGSGDQQGSHPNYDHQVHSLSEAVTIILKQS